MDSETLEREFFRLAELEGVSDIEELNRVLDRAVTLKNMLKNPQRVERVAAFVAKHFKETVEPMGYKAFLARYHLSEEEEQRIRKAFRKPEELPKILICHRKALDRL